MKRVLPALALVLIGALVFALWPTEAGGVANDRQPPSAGTPAPATTSGEPTASESSVEESGTSQEARTPLAQEPAAAVSEPPGAATPATLRGRCVDVHGTPLAGVGVKVTGWSGNRDRIERYRSEHGEVEWTDPPTIVTGPDGRFATSFIPPPPYQFTIDLTREGLQSMAGRWSEIAPGGGNGSRSEPSRQRPVAPARSAYGCRTHWATERCGSGPSRTACSSQ